LALCNLVGIKHPEGSIRAIAFGMLDFEDFSVVVKNRAQPPKPWRWEIYRAGRRSPVSYSAVHFETITEAKLAGKKALQLWACYGAE